MAVRSPTASRMHTSDTRAIGKKMALLNWKPNGNSCGKRNQTSPTPLSWNEPLSAAAAQPTAIPTTTDERRSQRFFAQLSRTMVPSVTAPRAILLVLAKALACSPPHQLITLTLIRLMPISAITLPVITGVKIRFSGSIKRLTRQGTSAATKLTPNSMAIISCGVPPCPFTHIPPAIATPRNAKLVPCIQIMPAPIPHRRLDCRKVPMPEASRDMLIK